jgi:hypothetical protein
MIRNPEIGAPENLNANISHMPAMATHAILRANGDGYVTVRQTPSTFAKESQLFAPATQADLSGIHHLVEAKGKQVS